MPLNSPAEHIPGFEYPATVVKMDVVGGGVSCVESDGLRDNEGDCLGFRLAYRSSIGDLGGSNLVRDDVGHAPE
jgi:hypothetical protein